jgi:gluconate 2-dehydrogenase gamma chain
MARQTWRRQFLGIGAAATVGGSAVSCSGGRWRFFTAEEARSVEAICAQIIPSDQDPGAREAGVVNYIDLQLSRHFKPHRATYRAGLADVDALSGGRFADLPAARQIEVLRQVERQAKPFFDVLVAHTMQGFYGDPRHGGNRAGVSWQMLGLPYPPVRGRGAGLSSDGYAFQRVQPAKKPARGLKGPPYKGLV